MICRNIVKLFSDIDEQINKLQKNLFSDSSFITILFTGVYNQTKTIFPV
jgi:hypothetical protein